jgi:parallel beta-helix repeat protein
MKVAEAALSIIRVPQDCPTIQAAINAVQQNGTIFVSEGLYYENIIINKPLQLIGANKDNTTIEGSRNGTIELVHVENVLIKGFTVKNNVTVSTFPIRLLYSNNNRIESCNLIASTTYSGVWLEYSHSNKIRNNNITNSGDYGVYLFESCNNTIADNMVATDNGILFSTYCEHNIVAGNTVITNNTQKLCLYLYTCSNNMFYHDSFIYLSAPVYNVNSINSWNNSFQEGNYWKNYAGAYNQTTGIGLTPYSIDANNKDNYPLRNPYIPGDANHDGRVNMTDADMIGDAWLSLEGELNYNPHADFNMDKIISIKDATIIGVNWLKKWEE